MLVKSYTSAACIQFAIRICSSRRRSWWQARPTKQSGSARSWLALPAAHHSWRTRRRTTLAQLHWQRRASRREVGPPRSTVGTGWAGRRRRLSMRPASISWRIGPTIA